MNVPYTAYVEIEYDRTNEGDYLKRVYSVDCKPEDLVFLSALANASRLGNADQMVRVVIRHATSLPFIAPNQHFASLENLMEHFGTVEFKSPHYKA